MTLRDGAEVCQVKRLEWGRGGNSGQWEQHMQRPGVGEGHSIAGKCSKVCAEWAEVGWK